MTTAQICPRCGTPRMREPTAINALSRTTREPDDEPVYVCSPCGVDETFEEEFGFATPQSDWPLVELTHVVHVPMNRDVTLELTFDDAQRVATALDWMRIDLAVTADDFEPSDEELGIDAKSTAQSVAELYEYVITKIGEVDVKDG